MLTVVGGVLVLLKVVDLGLAVFATFVSFSDSDDTHVEQVEPESSDSSTILTFDFSFLFSAPSFAFEALLFKA